MLEDAENGIINYPEGVTVDNVGYSLNLGWELPNQFIGYKWSGSDPQLWEKMEEFNNSAKASKALGFYFDDSQYENQIAALANVVKQYSGSLNSGSADPAVYIPEFVFLSSLTDENVLIRNGYSFFPEKFSFYAYQYIIRQGDKILRAYGVTIIVTIVGTVLNIAMSALMAYPLSVKTLPHRRALTFFTMLFHEAGAAHYGDGSDRYHQ